MNKKYNYYIMGKKVTFYILDGNDSYAYDFDAIVKYPENFKNSFNLSETEINHIVKEINSKRAFPEIVLGSYKEWFESIKIPNKTVQLSGKNHKEYQDAKKLLEIEYCDAPLEENEILDIYKEVFNLSQDEIDQILKEIEETEQPYKFGCEIESLPKIEKRKGYTIYRSDGNGNPVEIKELDQHLNKSNGNVCSHKMVSYIGLKESFNHCELCGQKE